ncbi:hypothetical protein PG994_000890 [Apiospora phragmitis]|uniref:Tyrosinase copper-binding domain-containing protein n=1 Tax=Apiospora phragmitis TaxID=2905665 RepID=A0ABR1WQV1_9PEZI
MLWAVSLLSGCCLATNELQIIDDLQVEATKALEASHVKREAGCLMKNAAYWNWFECPDHLTDSPVFDGSDTSMGDDGDYFEHNGTLIANSFLLPSGKGGGCVKSGPSANRTIHLGPLQPKMQGMSPVMTSIRDYNPRCLRRNLSVVPAAAFIHQDLHNLITGDASRTVGSFQAELQSS